MSASPNWVEISTLICVSLLGILHFTFIDYPQVKVTNALTDLNARMAALDLTIKERKNKLDLQRTELEIEEKKKNQELAQITLRMAELESGVKEYKDKMSLEGAILANKLNAIEVAVKDIKEHLEIKAKQVQLSSDITELIESLRPKIVVRYLQTRQLTDSKVEAFFSLKNTGSYSCNLQNPEILVTTRRVSHGNGARYRINSHTEYYGPSNNYPPGEEQTIQFIISFNQSVPRQFFARITFKYETPRVLVDSMSTHLRSTIQKTKLHQLVKGSFTMTYKHDHDYGVLMSQGNP